MCYRLDFRLQPVSHALFNVVVVDFSSTSLFFFPFSQYLWRSTVQNWTSCTKSRKKNPDCDYREKVLSLQREMFQAAVTCHGEFFLMPIPGGGVFRSMNTLGILQRISIEEFLKHV